MQFLQFQGIGEYSNNGTSSQLYFAKLDQASFFFFFFTAFMVMLSPLKAEKIKEKTES